MFKIKSGPKKVQKAPTSAIHIQIPFGNMGAMGTPSILVNTHMSCYTRGQASRTRYNE